MIYHLTHIKMANIQEWGRRKGKRMKNGIKIFYVHEPISHKECKHYVLQEWGV